MAIVLAVGLFAALSPQHPAAAGLPPADLVLVADADPVPLVALGLGPGGVECPPAGAVLEPTDDGCWTPGRVRVQCATAGVKLTFATGRELLFAPDGLLHLREGPFAGPFGDGVELHLGDGARVAIIRGEAQRQPLSSVTVQHGERALRLWHRGSVDIRSVRPRSFDGPRLWCCGDGGALYRGIGLGPVLVLQRELACAAAATELPAVRVAVLTDPLLQTLMALQRAHRQPDPKQRPGMEPVAAVARRSAQVFDAKASPPRVGHRELRWALGSGYELTLVPDGEAPLRLGLHIGDEARPFVEWSLGPAAAVWLLQPDGGIGSGSRRFGNGLPVPLVAREWQARIERNEVALARAALVRLRDGKAR